MERIHSAGNRVGVLLLRGELARSGLRGPLRLLLLQSVFGLPLLLLDSLALLLLRHLRGAELLGGSLRGGLQAERLSSRPPFGRVRGL
jgi:hypothetical protein